MNVGSGLDALEERCEAGPHLFGGLVGVELVDDLTSGNAGRIANGAGAEASRRMRLESGLHADSPLLTRCGRMRE
ncbi:hypothetical protein [Saccharopolyspora dendranthemae]|uniref:Uncharacterized protein n=1 Tax=Saccharopolyspora dendranthemae TaxID=1181886 RepID=A0A561U3S8_9PSEU|nr:hypothetical protein [Saccharopolyspora dendranthemae]TWF94019.1 hypothetical protein FHU35_14301 [Saccharopolyspora dendranthemae]